MNDFEIWWCDFSKYIALNMGIFLTVYDMVKFESYFEQGLSVEEAAAALYWTRNG